MLRLQNSEGIGEGGAGIDGEVGVEVGRDAAMGACGRGNGAGNGDALGMARNTREADRGWWTVHKRSRSEHTLVTVAGGLGYVEVEGKRRASGKGHQENAHRQASGRGGRSEAHGEKTLKQD